MSCTGAAPDPWPRPRPSFFGPGLVSDRHLPAPRRGGQWQRRLCRRARAEFPADGALESFEGADAYAFLLRFACGLESKLVAETEIFGQIKQAWREFSERGSPLARQLSPWMQLLFQDAKAVRAQYLAKLGSASYGSQVRRLLGDDANGGPTLLIGAGQLAQSVAPWLTGSRTVAVESHRPNGRAELARELAKRDPARPVRVIEGGTEAELAAWRAARNVIVCVPADARLDRARVAAVARARSIGRPGDSSGAGRRWRMHHGMNCRSSSASAHCSTCCRRSRSCGGVSSSAHAAPARRRPCCARSARTPRTRTAGKISPPFDSL